MTKDLARVIVEIRKELGFPELQYGDMVRSSHLNIYTKITEIVKAKFISYSLETEHIALIQVAEMQYGYHFHDLAKKHWVEAIEKSLNIKLDTSGYYLWVEVGYLSLDYEEESLKDTKD